MGGKKGKKSKKSKTKAQKAAAARHAKFKQTRVQTFGGKRTNFSKKEETRIKDAGYSVKGYSQAAPNKASGYSGTTGVSVGSTIKNPNPTTTGTGPVVDGSKYAESLSKATNQPTKKTTGIGPYADGAKYAAALKASPPDFGPKFKEANIAQTRFKSVPAPGVGPAGDNMSTKEFRESMLPGLRDVVPGESLQNTLKRITNTDGLASTDSSMSGLGIKTAPSYFRVKSPESFGYPSQAEVDKAAGITAGGLNIGGGGFTPDKPSGANARAIADYKSSLDPDSFKGLSDGETRGSGPVISGDDYARGLNVDNKNVENIGRSILNRIPGVNIRRLTDKEIADNRASAQKKLAYRKEMAQFRGARGGGARLPVAPLTPEEILLPEETAQTGVDYQQAQTGLDPNRLMQIQQEAYLQAFNPSYNPMFRFFGRRGMGRGSFRKAFRRKD